ncbi:hypothetical protein [Candidatus Magnetominusculus dajiuhuensis]|uniref:hypothetical protein n=1 Tax=Candidatus Magnetominusculus dajiuhuensis TaxID=3137712 RepID=UPI003B4310C7
MSVITMPRVLREKLGDEGVDALLTVFSEVSLNTRNDLATKSDIKEMATKSDLKEMATALRQEMATKEDIANLKTEIEKSKVDTIKWMIAFGATQVGILIAAMGLMFKFFIK